MIIKTNLPKSHWYRELKATVEPALMGVRFSLYAKHKDLKPNHVQVEIVNTDSSTHNKELMLHKLKGDSRSNQDILNGIAKFVEDRFGYIMHLTVANDT